MLSRLARSAVASGLLVIASSAAVAQTTTRIETRPFYGAIVTIEEGVRVFRPVPRTDRLIINPGGRTPLYLGFVEGNAGGEGPGFFRQSSETFDGYSVKGFRSYLRDQNK